MGGRRRPAPLFFTSTVYAGRREYGLSKLRRRESHNGSVVLHEHSCLLQSQ